MADAQILIGSGVIAFGCMWFLRMLRAQARATTQYPYTPAPTRFAEATVWPALGDGILVSAIVSLADRLNDPIATPVTIVCTFCVFHRIVEFIEK